MQKIDFVNSTQPALNDTNLNLMQDYIEMAINAQVSGDTLPVGAVLPFAGTVIPENWLLCDGREISRETYSQLFIVIGTHYGVGDGSTTFNLPNLKHRVPVGQDTSMSKFDTLGETGTIPTNSGELEHFVQKFIIKAFQTAGTVAQIVNAHNTSTTNAYSASYINGLNKYSTSVQNRVGTWIDGKPLYRRVFTKATTDTTTTIDLSGLSYENIFIEKAWFVLNASASSTSVNKYVVDPYYASSSDKARALILSNSKIQLESTETASKLWYVIVKYTVQ